MSFPGLTGESILLFVRQDGFLLALRLAGMTQFTFSTLPNQKFPKTTSSALALPRPFAYCTCGMRNKIKEAIKRVPLLGSLAGAIKRIFFSKPFQSSEAYWVNRYSRGGHSGSGSYGKLAEFKAEILNQFVDEHQIETVIEYGCGDGNQLKLATYPKYLGFDVSPHAVDLCRSIFNTDPTKQFKLLSDYANERAQITMSLDVIFHLVEESVYDSYMRLLFDSAERFVVIYSSNTDSIACESAKHEKHRRFSDWVEKNKVDWRLQRHIPNRYPYTGDDKTGSIADFYIYTKV